MQATIDRRSGSPPLGRDAIADVCALSPMQEGMLFHDLFETERSPGALIPHLVGIAFRVEGDFDADRFEESWNRLIARHEALRSVFNYTVAERPLQIVLRERRIALERHDLAGRPAAEQESFIAACRQRQRGTPFDLTRDLLLRIAVIRLAPRRHQVVWAFHHILMDGWCLNVLQRELLAIYDALGRGEEPRLPRPVPYSAYLKRLQARDAAASQAFWSGYLDGYEKPVHPAGWRRPAAGAGTMLLHHAFELDAAESAALRGLGAALQATVNNVFQAAWGLLLGRYNGCGDAVYGIVVAGRPHDVPGISDMVGLCANTVPLRVRTAPGTRLDDLIRSVRDGFLAVLAHEHDPLAEIQALTAPKRELVNHLLLFESFPRDLRFEGARIEPLPGLVLDGFESSMPNNYDFQIAVFPDEGRVVLTHREGAFHSGQAERMGGHLRRVLAAMVEDPSRTVESLDILAPEERAELLAGGASAPPLPGESLAARLERVLEGSGIAVTANGQDLTWEELNDRSGRLARQLAGIGPGSRVALRMPATPELIVGICAVIRTGAAFVPLDPANPEARTALILEDCQPALVLSSEGLERRTPTAPSPETYVLYTSGTTGRPKGVRVGEASLLNYVEWLRRRFEIGPGDATALLSSHAFDLGYTALFGALLNGARLHLPDERRDPEALIELCVAERLTFLKLTPALLHLLVHAANASRLAEAVALRLVFLGGESYVPADLRELRRLCPWVRLRNHYGPTESTIGCISYELDPEEPDVAAGRQVIGHPIDGVRAWVLDERREPVPAGVAGDLYVGGRCLALGYTSGPSGADAERFAAAPWDAAERLYRTGDRAELRPDGALLFLGRSDDQLKIRGYRVEPGEIESALRRIPGVSDAVVLARQGELTAFALCARCEPGAEPDAGELRNLLAAELPEYMVPAQVVPVFRFPLTANGKVDREALAAHQPLLRRAPSGKVTGEASGETETAIREIWQAVLGLDSVGPDDDFFQLGGHSVKAILVLSRVAKKLGVKLAVRDFFDHPTLRRLARRVEAGRSGARGPAVPLKTAGPAAPRLFFLPPVAGTSTLYKEVVEALEVEVSAWGLQCRGFDADEPFDPSLAEMAARFAAGIRGIQPRGPYLLCGYSMGVACALEVAALLEAGGEQASLILVDGAPGPGFEGADTFAGLRAERHWEHVLSILAGNLDQRDLERIGRLVEHNLRLVRDYRPTALLGAHLFCIEAADNPGPPRMQALSRLTNGGFSYRRTPGDHYSLFHPPNSAALLGHLAEAVRTARRS